MVDERLVCPQCGYVNLFKNFKMPISKYDAEIKRKYPSAIALLQETGIKVD